MKRQAFTLEDSKDATRFDPGRLPWVVVPELPGSSVGTIFNSANEPIGTLQANSKSQLSEMARLLEEATRGR